MHIIMKDATNRIIVFFKNSKKKKNPMNEERERDTQLGTTCRYRRKR